MFSEQKLYELRNSVKKRLGENRFKHTLGVEIAASRLAEILIPDKLSEIRAAALLHDITKELSDREQMNIIKGLDFITDSDIMSSAIYHSLTAPEMIRREYPEFATEDILSAVFNHTTGDPDMSVFDEIIFVSDYIEYGRTYSSCVALRDELWTSFDVCKNSEDILPILHEATIKALENTILSLIQRKHFIHEKTVMTRNAFLGRRPMPLN